MLCKTRGIVLHSIPYNDKYSIIYMYTEAFGRASYLVARSRGKKSSVSKALFMPLSVVEIIGYDGIFLDQVVSPRLTTIRQDVAKLGEICGEMLLNKIEQKGKKQGFKLLDPMLVKRETTRQKGGIEKC